ncbi:DUF481 domain-containing protein [Flavitalea sp.]|nr:DUF481 domain-containing protein [Flavitalea sp.]
MRQKRNRAILPILLTIILFALESKVQAQFSDSITRYISYTATGVINKTDDGDSYVLNNNLRFNVRRKDVSLNAAAGWIYGEQNDQRTNNDFTSSLDFNLFKTFKHFYYWGLTTYEKSFSLKINDRFQTGLGIAYNIVEKKPLFINVSEGVLFEKSDVFINDTTREKNNILRNSFRFRYRWVIKEIITLDGTHLIQNSLSDGNDYILKSVNGLSFRLYKWLNFTTALTYNRVGKTDRQNLLVTFGLTAEKYF